MQASLKQFIGLLAAVALPIPFLVGCSRQTETNAETTGRKVFEVRGVVRELRPAEREIVIKHEEIPDYMPAMTMPFEVKNVNEMTGLATNDLVTFTMIVTEREGWIENVKKIGVDTNIVTVPKERASTRIVRDVEPLEIGDKMPDYTFTNTLGRQIKLSDFAGEAYAYTFIFTRCPFPNFCPRMNSHFSDAYQQLLKMPSAPTNWHLFSVSFDPEFDTPERLKNYSSMYDADPKKWEWVTGAMSEIDAIAEQVGLIFAFENGTYNHNLRTAVVDKNGQVRKIFTANEWTPQELADEIIAGAEGRPIQKESKEP